MAIFSSCIQEESPIATDSSSHTLIEPGDLVVTNYTGDSALLLNPDGEFKSILYNVENNLEQIVGVNWNPLTERIVLSINGVPDRIIEIDPFDGSDTEVIVNANLNGNTFGVAVDSITGDYLAIETSRIEKFTAQGLRVNDGTFPTGNILTSMVQINFLNAADGSFLVCGYGGDRVRTYDADVNQLNEVASGIGGTTDAYGCFETASGNIAAAWRGSTDTIALYNSDFTTTIATFSDTTVINDPRNIIEKADGNFLVCDAGFDYIVELDSSLNFVRNLGGGVLNDPFSILEVPEY